MKRCIIFLLTFMMCLPVSAEEMPALSAKSAICIEYHTGKVIYAKNGETPLPMASTTKIMTALLALEEGNLQDVVTVSERAANIEGSSMYLQAGEKITLEELLYGLMLSSGNDAAVAIAEHLAGSETEFAKRMTEKAIALGCKNTKFQNASGLPHDEHFTTALELARITGKALENEKFREIVSQKSVTVAGRTIENHNKMLSIYDGAIGVKTGYTKKAGRTLVSAANRGGVELIAVTLSAPDDWTDHQKMLDYAFSKMERRQILTKGENVGTVNVQGGICSFVTAHPKEDVFLSVLQTDETKYKIILEKDLAAPVEKGSVIGRAEIFLQGVKMGEVPLVAAEKVLQTPKPSLWHYVLFVFQFWGSLYVAT